MMSLCLLLSHLPNEPCTMKSTQRDGWIYTFITIEEEILWTESMQTDERLHAGFGGVSAQLEHKDFCLSVRHCLYSPSVTPQFCVLPEYDY